MTRTTRIALGLTAALTASVAVATAGGGIASAQAPGPALPGNCHYAGPVMYEQTGIVGFCQFDDGWWWFNGSGGYGQV